MCLLFKLFSSRTRHRLKHLEKHNRSQRHNIIEDYEFSALPGSFSEIMPLFILTFELVACNGRKLPRVYRLRNFNVYCD